MIKFDRTFRAYTVGFLAGILVAKDFPLYQVILITLLMVAIVLIPMKGQS